MDQILCTNCQARVPSQDSWQSHSVGPRITELLDCNEAPLESEIDPMRSYLNDANSRLRYVEDDITRLKESLALLEDERKTLKEHIVNGRKVLHPIRRMPSELLQTIFGFCVEGDSESGVFSLDVKGAHWVLGYVCHRWRSIMLSSPRLWTDIRLELSTHSSPLSWRTVLLVLYLGRSESLPLCVNLFAVQGNYYRGSYYYPESSWDHLNHKHAILDALSPSVSRWSSLYVVGMAPDLIQRCFSSIKPCLSSLRALSIFAKSAYTSGVNCDIFRDVSTLREVVLHGDWQLPSNFLFQIPFRELTVVEIDGAQLNLSHLLGCLAEMNQLAKLIIKSLSLIATGGSNEIAPLLLPQIRYFELLPQTFHLGEITADQLLALLALPGIAVLSVRKVGPGAIQSLITRSSCTLEQLQTDAKLSEDDFILMASNPSLSLIDFMDIQGLTDVAIAELTVREGCDGPCLPKLETIRLCGSLSFDAAKFVNMIESRLKASAHGGNIARPRTIEVGRSTESQSKPTNLIALDRFNESHFKGLEWKISGY